MQREKKLGGGVSLRWGWNDFFRWGGMATFLFRWGGRNARCPALPPPSHPISKQPGQLQLQMYSCIIYPLNLVQGLIQKFWLRFDWKSWQFVFLKNLTKFWKTLQKHGKILKNFETKTLKNLTKSLKKMDKTLKNLMTILIL